MQSDAIKASYRYEKIGRSTSFDIHEIGIGFLHSFIHIGGCNQIFNMYRRITIYHHLMKLSYLAHSFLYIVSIQCRLIFYEYDSTILPSYEVVYFDIWGSWIFTQA